MPAWVVVSVTESAAGSEPQWVAWSVYLVPAVRVSEIQWGSDLVQESLVDQWVVEWAYQLVVELAAQSVLESDLA